jgi:GT2 family glycosyltransferase
MPRVAPPSITIVTPCLNAAATLPEALASVRRQGCPDVEHLVIDGGSTDGTVDLLGATEGVEWISEPDRGLSDAVNKGLARARGDVIGWLNADDVYLPGALERVARALEERPDAPWATGPCVIEDGEGREIRSWVSAYKALLLRHYSYGLLLTQNFVACPATFVRRSSLERVGVLDERFRYSMDYDLWLRVGRLGDPVVMREPLAAFRMAEGSLSMSGFERQFAEHAQNAREHGRGHRLAVLANGATSRAIVAAYRGMRLARALRSRPASDA